MFFLTFPRYFIRPARDANLLLIASSVGADFIATCFVFWTKYLPNVLTSFSDFVCSFTRAAAMAVSKDEESKESFIVRQIPALRSPRRSTTSWGC
jgi:hypothetical protein